MSTADTGVPENATEGPTVGLAAIEPRALLTRFLLGEGIELGPGHHPFVLPLGGASVRYVDRWEPSQNKELFPELGGTAVFPEPDVVANLDTDRLRMIPSGSQDFVIASHVLEHLAEPLGQIEDIYRVLRDGGATLILLPDRRHTFDRLRCPTPLAHLVVEHEQGVTTISDAHIEEFIRNTGGWNADWTDDDRQKVFDLQRNRSIHVHCWTEEEFLAVLEHTMAVMGMRWELLDTLFVDEVPGSLEFGMVLRKSTSDLPIELLATHLRSSWEAQLLQAKHAQNVEAQRRRAERAEASLQRFRDLPGYSMALGLWRAVQRLRSHF